MLAPNKVLPLGYWREPGLLGRKLLWIGTAVAIVLGGLWQFYPVASTARNRLADIPLRGTGFQGLDVPLTDTERVVLGRVDLVNRRYQFGDRLLFVSAVDGTDDRHAVHDPRYCFQGAGWRLLSERPMPLPGGEGTRLELARGADRFETLYWFAEGSTRYSSFLRYWWRTTLRRLTLGKFGAEPLLVVVQDLDAQDHPAPLAPNDLITVLHL